MAIPKNIERKHIIQAIEEIKNNGVRQGREGFRYFLVHDDGKHYPLKYIISLANKYVNGEELDPNPNNFNTYSAWNFLADMGFKLIDIYSEKITSNNGFKLLSLELHNNSLICKNSSITYNFIDDEDLQDEIYSTVIIGSNGTGKSNLFRIIILLFKDIYDYINNNQRRYEVDGKYNLTYSIDENVYNFTNYYNPIETKVRNITMFLKNDEHINAEEMELPSFIVANSIMLTDKYPFIRDAESFPIYKYLGVRNIAQAASTRSYVRKTVEFIVNQINSDVFKFGITKTGEFLGISKSIDIIFQTVNTSLFFKGDLDVYKLEDYFNRIQEAYKSTEKIPPFKLNHYLSISHNKELLQRICDLSMYLYGNGRLYKKDNSPGKIIKFNIVDEKEYLFLKENYELLEHLRKLGMLSAPEINLNKGDEYNLNESSSGEYHFFSSMIGLLATVKPNSLVFIDEPEISLHPNWQMKYLSFLRELFSDEIFATSHILIATHSHFIISDLKGDNSKIIGLKKDNNNNNVIVDLPKNMNTFGWTTEEVLYSIFNVRSTRNSFFEYDLTKMVTMLNRNSTDFDEINRLVKKFSTLKLSENDPLNIIIEKATKYLNNHA